ncbi:MAG: precorrin-2 C(20)-methyltransferase [Desulfobacteraceae bacterium]|jgi:precorrin-2/cobalt-factor-2 C20-methyltransferase
MTKKTEHGTLYGIGVGPGDPELIPVKAVEILKNVDVIFAAASSKNNHSRAVNIAGAYIPAATRLQILPFPMCKDEAEKAAAWKSHAGSILAVLQDGLDAAFLTLGDPLTYATYGYILKSMQALAPHVRMVTVPGISSFQAAAARVNIPLVEGNESLTVVSGIEGGDAIRKLETGVDNLVIMKAYKNVEDITAALAESGRVETSVAVVNCSMENEKIIEDVRELNSTPPGYWTLILSKKNGHE